MFAEERAGQWRELVAVVPSFMGEDEELEEVEDAVRARRGVKGASDGHGMGGGGERSVA